LAGSYAYLHDVTSPERLQVNWEQDWQFQNCLGSEQFCTVRTNLRYVAFLLWNNVPVSHGRKVGLSKTNSVRRSAEGIGQWSSDFYCFSEWSQHFIYADSQSNVHESWEERSVKWPSVQFWPDN